MTLAAGHCSLFVVLLHHMNPLNKTDMANPQTDPSVQQYISSLTHQLKSPLTTIHLYSEALQTGMLGALNEEQQAYVKEIYTASEKMIKQINELRDQAKQ